MAKNENLFKNAVDALIDNIAVSYEVKTDRVRRVIDALEATDSADLQRTFDVVIKKISSLDTDKLPTVATYLVELKKFAKRHDLDLKE